MPEKPVGARPKVKIKTVRARGVDPASVNPLRILAALAKNPRTPAHARVSACKALIAARGKQPESPTGAELPAEDALSRRAAEIMARTARLN